MEVYQLLQAVKDGRLDIEAAAEHLRKLPYEDLDFAKLDHHRTLRSGFGEVIYAAGKSVEQLQTIVQTYVDAKINVLATKVTAEQALSLKNQFPSVQYDAVSATLRLELKPPIREGCICVCTGGTSDMAVAEEAAVTAEFFGSKVERIYDIGIAGIHRLFDQLPRIHQANCCVAVAGMEGALGSVLAGLVDKPVIAVPTSVGYGASFGGLSALLTMLNSCAEGLSVVNIDNGFGAGYLAAQINRLAVRGNTRALENE